MKFQRVRAKLRTIPSKVKKRLKNTRSFLKFKSLISSSAHERLISRIKLLKIKPEFKEKLLELAKTDQAKKITKRKLKYIIHETKRRRFEFRGLDKPLAIAFCVFLLEKPNNKNSAYNIVLNDLANNCRYSKPTEVFKFLDYALEFVLENQEMITNFGVDFSFNFLTCLAEFYFNFKEKTDQLVSVGRRCTENQISLEIFGIHDLPFFRNSWASWGGHVPEISFVIFPRLLQRKRQAESNGEIGVLNEIPLLVRDLFLLFELNDPPSGLLPNDIREMKVTETEFTSLFSALADANPDLVEHLGKRLIRRRFS